MQMTDERFSIPAQLFEVPDSSILVWFFYSVYFFYGTGHQPAFPNIRWEAAFLGTGDRLDGTLVPGALVVANTFGSHFVMGATLPLVLMAPFALYPMFPGLASAGRRGGEAALRDCARGEVVLYENDGRMLSAAFIVSCKYMLLHCLRVSWGDVVVYRVFGPFKI